MRARAVWLHQHTAEENLDRCGQKRRWVLSLLCSM